MHLLKSINPVNGETVREFQEYQWEEVDEIMDLSLAAYGKWRRVPYLHKAELFVKLASLLLERKEGLAFNISLEMGKPIVQSRSEIEKCARLCEYYAENGEGFLRPQRVSMDSGNAYVSFQPLGPVLAIMPWNFPFWQVFRCAIPTLACGNSVILKHASNVPGCTLAIESLFKEAGFPENVFRCLLVTSRRIEKIVSDKRIVGVSLTGGPKAGRAVAGVAGSYLKKSVLELGGSDPYIVLADADLDMALDICLASRMINTGQSCIAAKRFIVVKELYNDFQEGLVSRMKKVTMGDPFDEGNDIGPLAQNKQREDLHRQVLKSVKKGARLLLGGEFSDGDGNFYPPTVLGNVDQEMPAFNTELFGPVASLIEVANEQEAIKKANETSLGLGAAIFSRDIEKALRIGEFELEAGSCFINGCVKSDPRLPFGGVKESGYGRELASFGMHEFVNVKTIFQK